MTELDIEPTATDDGQSVQEPDGSQTIQAEPNTVDDGQSVSPPGTTDDGLQGDTVFDPAEFKRLTENLDPEILKQVTALQTGLQGAYTKKFQSISNDRQKIEAFDAFNADPVATIKQMAQQYGVSLGDSPTPDGEGEFDPQNWGDVFAKVKDVIMKDLSPVLNEVQNIKRTSIEKQLLELDPGYKQYEDKMLANIKEYPNLVNNPAALYRLSVPQEVLESRATQAALAKMQKKVDSGRVSGNTATTKTTTSGLPDKALTFQEAVSAAKKKLKDEGLKP